MAASSSRPLVSEYADPVGRAHVEMLVEMSRMRVGESPAPEGHRPVIEFVPSSTLDPTKRAFYDDLRAAAERTARAA